MMDLPPTGGEGLGGTTGGGRLGQFAGISYVDDTSRRIRPL